jgi:DMSO reductase iron-sulfur subunit
MIPVRADEPTYARLYDPASAEVNRIKLTPVDDDGESLNINGDCGIGFNPNRTKQHAFHFNADNCIGCHACEAACSEKNDLPPHLSFRSVGYVEGGTFPDFTRMNISMACNHCDDPVCLKGCPTRAYTKHPEYGAVIQDPDICFGCGYCTWVCPYNAPQLDPVGGQVEKCNMCVDRLEVGLKPACVSACVGNALDFGVVENMPSGASQIETTLPGFPDPSITQPNIRFQQTKKLPYEMRRTDDVPVKYRRDPDDGRHKPVVDRNAGHARFWNIRRLSSRENPLVVFTLSTQAAIGTFVAGLASGIADASFTYTAFLMVALALIGAGLFMSTMHLGKPVRFYRGFNNLRHSPVSREGLATVIFGAMVVLHGLCSLVPQLTPLVLPTALAAVIAGVATLAFMVQCYLIRARPFWNHWQTVSAFAGTALNLGGWLVLLYVALVKGDIPTPIVVMIMAGMLLEALGHVFHARDLGRAEHEGAVSHYVQTTTFGWTYIARNLALAGNVALLGVWLLLDTATLPAYVLIAIAGVSAVLTATVGRALFYVLVIPTTMPGAFFWKNKTFEQHARDIGLDANPHAGIAPLRH